MDRIEYWLAESQLIPSPDPEPWPALELACIESEEHPPPIGSIDSAIDGSEEHPPGRRGSIDSILDAVDRSEEHPPPIVGRRASIDSILDAIDRARSETSFDQSSDDSNGEHPDNDINEQYKNSGDGEPGEGQASRHIKRARVRGKNYAKNRYNRRRRILKKELEEGYERVEKFFGKKLYPEQRLVLAYLHQNKDVILRARTGFGKSMLFFGLALMTHQDLLPLS